MSRKGEREAFKKKDGKRRRHGCVGVCGSALVGVLMGVLRGRMLSLCILLLDGAQVVIEEETNFGVGAST